MEDVCAWTQARACDVGLVPGCVHASMCVNMYSVCVSVCMHKCVLSMCVQAFGPPYMQNTYVDTLMGQI